MWRSWESNPGPFATMLGHLCHYSVALRGVAWWKELVVKYGLNELQIKQYWASRRLPSDIGYFHLLFVEENPWDDKEVLGTQALPKNGSSTSRALEVYHKESRLGKKKFFLVASPSMMTVSQRDLHPLELVNRSEEGENKPPLVAFVLGTFGAIYRGLFG
ncbi:hypothetical protein GQ53DRAFT_804787 [Thozetella sp. PMI_491]|nr:hypothetical protein GQ53DRAFT_804787 [Thozetella sp. PMI_491]